MVGRAGRYRGLYSPVELPRRKPATSTETRQGVVTGRRSEVRQSSADIGWFFLLILSRMMNPDGEPPRARMAAILPPWDLIPSES